MSTNPPTRSRRRFLKGAALGLVGPSIIPRSVLGTADQRPANERVVAALIGCGGRGKGLLPIHGDPRCTLAAVCDCDEKRVAEVQKRIEGSEVYTDFRPILDRRDIDAILIATPDQWHAPMTIMGCQAGKDVYCEKPLSRSIGEGRKMIEVARRYDRVVQMGTQYRSMARSRQPCEWVRNGRLGKVHTVRLVHAPNRTHPCEPPQPVPPNLDWDMWLGPAPARPFNINRFGVVDDGRWSSFRWFWDYAGGMMTDWGTHLIDIVLWAMKVKGPEAVSTAGDKFALLDNRDTPDTMVATFQFPGFICTYENRKAARHSKDGRGYGIIFHGTDASLFVDRGGFSLEPETVSRGRESEPKTMPLESGDSEQHQTHVKAFIDCVRSRKRFISDIEEGHYASSTPHLANISLRLGRSLRWDPQAERFIGDAEADRMLSRTYRAPWSLA